MLRALQKKTIKLFLTREARYDFEFSVANASENDCNAPKARYDCAPCYCKMLSTVLFCVSRCGECAFSISRGGFVKTGLLAFSASFFEYFQVLLAVAGQD